jgi:hypothetical protein
MWVLGWVNVPLFWVSTRNFIVITAGIMGSMRMAVAMTFHSKFATP